MESASARSPPSALRWGASRSGGLRNSDASFNDSFWTDYASTSEGVPVDASEETGARTPSAVSEKDACS